MLNKINDTSLNSMCLKNLHIEFNNCVKQNSNNASLNNMNFKIIPHFEFNNRVKQNFIIRMLKTLFYSFKFIQLRLKH